MIEATTTLTRAGAHRGEYQVAMQMTMLGFGVASPPTYDRARHFIFCLDDRLYQNHAR